MENKNFFSPVRLIPFSFGLIVTVAALAAALNSGVRTQLREKWSKPYRKVLRTDSRDLFNEGTRFKVVKIKTDKGLFVEVYGPFEGSSGTLFSRIDLQDKRDGFFHFQGQATNLALDDIDGDGILEIIAPTFDQHLHGNLNVFTYNEKTQSFKPFTK